MSIPLAGLHPTIAQALAPHFSGPINVRREAYERALAGFDWQFEFSDDGAYVIRARQRLRDLRAVQRELDPDGVIWARYDRSGT